MRDMYRTDSDVEEIVDTRNHFEKWTDDTGEYIMKYPLLSGSVAGMVAVYISLVIASIKMGRKGLTLGWVNK